jgi:hypothetical protein
MTSIKKEKSSAYSPWTEELDAMLEEAYCEGKNVPISQWGIVQY